MTEVTSSTLTKNALTQFILKFEFDSLEPDVIIDLINNVSNKFDRTEKRLAHSIAFKIEMDNAEFEKHQSQDYICVVDEKGISLTFSEHEKSITFVSTKYKNKDTYLGTFEDLINACNILDIKLNSRRIGMRFINEFQCDNKQKIGKIFDKRLAGVIRSMLLTENISRIVAMEEQTNLDYKMRAQYGIINKYYPEPIRLYDLMLDIDVYVDVALPVDQFRESMKLLNQNALYFFKKCINQTFYDKLK